MTLKKMKAPNMYRQTSQTFYSRSPFILGEYIQDPKWMPETSDSTKPYIHTLRYFLYMHNFSFKGSTLQVLFGISKLSAPLLMHAGVIIKKSKVYLNMSIETL